MAKSKDTGSKSLKDTLADIDSHFGKGTESGSTSKI